MLEAGEISRKSLPAAIINENVSSVLDSLADDVAVLLLVVEQINTNIQPQKILMGVAKSENAEMLECRKLKAGILKPRINKIKHRTDKGRFTRTTQA